jgi:mandelate racemase
LKTPVQIGENFSLASGMAVALEQAKPDYVMPDLERIGGITGWRQAAEIAAVNRIPMSSHLFPETSAHLLAPRRPAISSNMSTGRTHCWKNRSLS